MRQWRRSGDLTTRVVIWIIYITVGLMCALFLYAISGNLIVLQTSEWKCSAIEEYPYLQFNPEYLIEQRVPTNVKICIEYKKILNRDINENTTDK